MKRNLLSSCVVLLALVLGSTQVGVAQRKIAYPMVAFAEVPLYPPLARAANLSGVVHVVVTTDGHRVVKTHVQDGPKILAAAAEKNAKSWRFAVHEPTTFTITYIYKLVDDIDSMSSNPRVILNLPTRVEIDRMRRPTAPL